MTIQQRRSRVFFRNAVFLVDADISALVGSPLDIHVLFC